VDGPRLSRSIRWLCGWLDGNKRSATGLDRACHRFCFLAGSGVCSERAVLSKIFMSEELVLVFGIILATGIVGYLVIGGSFGMKLSPGQIALFASNAGFTGDDLVTAVAIALAESSGNPQAQGDFIGGQYTSYGLWQIHFTVHPEFDASKLFDPQYNANAAYQLYVKRNGFKDWSTYNTGAYSAHLNDAQAGVNV
jgi:hypothetical protein